MNNSCKLGLKWLASPFLCELDKVNLKVWATLFLTLKIILKPWFSCANHKGKWGETLCNLNIAACWCSVYVNGHTVKDLHNWVLWDGEPHFNLLYHLSSRLLSSSWHCPPSCPPQVPTSHMKPKEQTTQRMQIQPSSMPRVATPILMKRRSTTSNQNRIPHLQCPAWDTEGFFGTGRGGKGGGWQRGWNRFGGGVEETRDFKERPGFKPSSSLVCRCRWNVVCV